jgi:hypothetical protein
MGPRLFAMIPSRGPVMKLRLPDVTLVMIDTQCHELARLAMEDSLRDVEFGDAVIFSDEPRGPVGSKYRNGRTSPNARTSCGTNCPTTLKRNGR